MPDSLRLLQLPSELRNKIYKLVLTSDKPIHLIPPLNDVASKRNRHYLLTHSQASSSLLSTELNQLKYANKQLYSEVRLLELKFKTLTVALGEESSGRFPAEQFLKWLTVLHPSKLPWIKG